MSAETMTPKLIRIVAPCHGSSQEAAMHSTPVQIIVDSPRGQSIAFAMVLGRIAFLQLIIPLPLSFVGGPVHGT